MNRILAFLALLFITTGCTRYGTRLNGPFARHPKSDSTAGIPPGPSPNSSPLALATDTRPDAHLQPSDRVIPPRPNDPVPLNNGYDPVGGIASAGATAPADGSFPPRRRRTEPDPTQIPSPFAPKDAGPAAPTAPSQPQPAADPVARNLAEVRKLVTVAGEQWAKVDTYEAVVTRRELSPKGKMCDDVVLYQFRKEPMAVYIRATDEANAGRELVYNPGRHGDKIYSIVGKADAAPFFPAGKKAPEVTPDSPFVRDKSRYSIREAGYGTPIARVGNWVAKAESGKIPATALTSLGLVTRPEFNVKVAGVRLELRPGDDALMPRGGVRQWFFDADPNSTSYGLPLLIVATEPNGTDVEYYRFDKLRFGLPFTDADFSPDRLGGKK